ncbi:hypothetical protein K449DRAFT_429585 [Hypoxylon sp. EC38]|nr:hypothetical protein K449DRAFT_429585 [Hypoxylon sp. EC38]
MHHSQISLLRREMYGNSQRRSLRTPRRAQSLPPPNKQNAPRVKGESEKPQRSLSLKLRVMRLPLIIPRHIARNAQLDIETWDEDYDSDEEDRRNGVPIIVVEDRGCELTSKMKTDVAQKIEQRLEKICSLQKQFRILRFIYLTVREFLFKSRGPDWDECMWSRFNTLEDEYCEEKDEIYELECEITHLETILGNLTNAQLLSRNGWAIKGNGKRSWCSSSGDTYGGQSTDANIGI